MSEPNIVARIEKNKLEEVVVALDEFRGTSLLDIRVWADFDGEGERRPTKKGIAVKVEKLPEIIAVLEKAREAAERHGLLRHEG